MALRSAKYGDTGKGVRALQEALLTIGHELVFDGEFGDATLLAVQKFQAAHGIKASGIVGVKTIKALERAVSAAPPPAEHAPSKLDAAPWLSYMRAITGTREIPGAMSNPLILSWRDELLESWQELKPNLSWYKNDDTPWCGLAVAYVIGKAGYMPPVAPLRALNWHTSWSMGKRLLTPVQGAVLVFKRPGGGHVGLYESEDETAYNVRGGNQANSVNVTRIAKNRCVGIMWPRDAPVPKSARRVFLSARGKLSTNES